MSWLLHPVTHCLSFYPHIPFACSVHSQDNEHQSGWTSLYWSQRRPMACWYLKHVKNYQEIPSGCALFFWGFFKCWISWWFYLFSLPLISLPSVGSSQCFSELFCQWPDRQWHGQLEEHGEKGRGDSSWWQGHAPASYHCKSPEGLCCQPIRCGENSAFV